MLNDSDPPDSHADYEHLGPSILAATPEEPARKPKKNQAWQAARPLLEGRLSQLRNWRLSWVEHWYQLSSYILPRRSQWLTQGGMNQPVPNSMVRGLPINQNILDETGTIAMRTSAAGIMSGLTSESRPWFKLRAAQKGQKVDADGQAWLEQVEDILYDIMATSNFYATVAQQDEDLITFGTAPMLIYEDDRDIIRCYGSMPGEYYLANSADLRPESFFRQINMTVAQIIEMFGIENCPAEVISAWKSKGGSLDREMIIAHAIEPNYPMTSAKGKLQLIDSAWTYREVYWVWGTSSDVPLSLRGFDETPLCAPRWALSGNDPYGRSPCMDALPSIMQLQVEQARKMEAIEKQVRPPLLADASLKEQPSSTLPGHVTYVAQLGPQTGMRPIYEVQPDLNAMVADIQDVRDRIRKTLFTDLMLLVTEQRKDMTAYEVAQLKEEKLNVLGPVIQRLQNENLKPAIRRIYRIAARKGLFPPMPESMKGVALGLEYISLLALAQKAAATAAMERVVNTAGTMAKMGMPDALLAIDPVATMGLYADRLDVPIEMMRTPKAIAQLQAAQQQQQQSAQQMQAMESMSKSAGNIGLDVGGGLGAIQTMGGMQ